MKKTYKVFSLNPQQVEIDVSVGGKTVKALVDANIAQLLPEVDDGAGTLKLAVDKEHLEKFKVGSIITAEFSAE